MIKNNSIKSVNKQVFISLSFYYLMVIIMTSCGHKDKPTIYFDNEVIDIGTIKVNKKRHISFPFNNIGNDTLVIISITKSCGCTSPVWNEKIPPRATDSIIVKIKMRDPGYFERFLTIYSTGSKWPISLTIKGTAMNTDTLQ